MHGRVHEVFFMQEIWNVAILEYFHETWIIRYMEVMHIIFFFHVLRFVVAIWQLVGKNTQNWILSKNAVIKYNLFVTREKKNVHDFTLF
jgi:hypothetical protein